MSALKADPDLADIPVIMLTMVDDKSLGYMLGAAEYLTKPIDRDRLAAVLAEVPRRNRPSPAVLVVEDDESTRQAIRRALEREGWAVAEAENGRAGLARMAEAVPALILLDLMMPEMDGFEFLDELRRHEAWQQRPGRGAHRQGADDGGASSGCRVACSACCRRGRSSRDELLREIRRLVAASARQTPTLPAAG